MAGITAELDPAVVKEGEQLQHRHSGPVVVVGLFPLFEEKYRPIGDPKKSIRERVHLLIDAFFDSDERVEEGHFFNITLNL